MRLCTKAEVTKMFVKLGQEHKKGIFGYPQKQTHMVCMRLINQYALIFHIEKTRLCYIISVFYEQSFKGEIKQKHAYQRFE